jgi:hypothetical protein
MFLNKKNKNIDTPKELVKRIEKLEKEITEAKKDIEELREKNKKNLKKVGIIRFNPFKEIGGDQSFSIAVLDEKNDGFVITSHYGREANRIYAKPIKDGKSEYVLSKEEVQVIDQATNS